MFQPYLDWWPRVELLYNYGPSIRKIFHECVDKVQAHVNTSPRGSQVLPLCVIASATCYVSKIGF